MPWGRRRQLGLEGAGRIQHASLVERVAHDRREVALDDVHRQHAREPRARGIEEVVDERRRADGRAVDRLDARRVGVAPQHVAAEHDRLQRAAQVVTDDADEHLLGVLQPLALDREAQHAREVRSVRGALDHVVLRAVPHRLEGDGDVVHAAEHDDRRSRRRAAHADDRLVPPRCRTARDRAARRRTRVAPLRARRSSRRATRGERRPRRRCGRAAAR